jgi:signal transduction histidine kinase
VTRRLDWDAPVLDAVAAVAIGVAGIVDVLLLDDRVGPVWANVAAMGVLAGLVLVRRRLPREAGYGFVALLVVLSLWLTPPPDLVAVFVGLLLFPYALGSRIRSLWSYLYVPTVFAAICFVNLRWEHVTVGDYVFPTALALASYAAGRNVIHRSALAHELQEAAQRAGEEREAEARRSVAAERRRIAREMHDVVAHSISVMVVQAGGARRILERDPARAEEAAAEIERTGRETLLEMRRLLGVMRRPDAAPELEPNPTLDGLHDLVARARATGLPVDLRVEGPRRPLSPGLEMAAYRVAQDALDEVLRVARDVRTEVLVRWAPDALELTVSDDRPGVPFAEGAGLGGRVLIGVRERVALYGGELRTGLRAGGGHEVHVRFPLDTAPGDQPPTDPVPAQGTA